MSCLLNPIAEIEFLESVFRIGLEHRRHKNARSAIRILPTHSCGSSGQSLLGT